MNYEMEARKVYNDIVANNLSATTSISLIQKELKKAVEAEREESIKALLNCFNGFNGLKTVNINFKTRVTAVFFILFKPVMYFKSVFKAMQITLVQELKKRDYA